MNIGENNDSFSKNNCAIQFGELRAIELIAKAGFDSFETEEEISLGLKLSEIIGRKMIGKIENYRTQPTE